jgi:hypothetical protein
VEDKIRLSELQKWIDITVMMQHLNTHPVSDPWRTAAHPPSGVDTVVLCAYYALVKISELDSKNYYVLDYDQIMMICDTMSARTFTLWYNDLLPENSPGKIPDTVIHQIYKLFDESLKTNGNSAYR